jgi:hypothetical protein
MAGLRQRSKAAAGRFPQIPSPPGWGKPPCLPKGWGQRRSMPCATITVGEQGAHGEAPVRAGPRACWSVKVARVDSGNGRRSQRGGHPRGDAPTSNPPLTPASPQPNAFLAALPYNDAVHRWVSRLRRVAGAWLAETPRRIDQVRIGKERAPDRRSGTRAGSRERIEDSALTRRRVTWTIESEICSECS